MVTYPVAAAVPAAGALMVVGFVTLMQPFGEHKVFVGQHPPPSNSKHSKKLGMHFGSSVRDPSHPKAISFELQQYMFDGVNGVG